MSHILSENPSDAFCHALTDPLESLLTRRSTHPEKRGNQLLGRSSALRPKPFQALKAALCNSKIQFACRGPSSSDQPQLFEVIQIGVGSANGADSDFVGKSGSIHPISIF